MADAYTSIATTGGWSTNTVKEAYDLLFGLSLRSMPLCRQFVDVRPRRLTHQGDSQTLQIEQAFGYDDVKSATAALTEESDVDATKLPSTKKITLTPNEFGFANVRTLKLANRSMTPVDPVIAREVAFHCARTIDWLVQTEMRGGDNVVYGGDATQTSEVAAGDLITSDDIRYAVTEMNSNSVHPRSEGGAQGYVMVLHPRVARNIREETGAGGWRQPKEYVDPANIYSGELGEYEGVRYVQTPTVFREGNGGTDKGDSDDGASSIAVYRSFLLGAEALAESVITEPGFRLGPVTDKLSRFRTCGWYADLDFGRYREEALYRFETAVA